jgi:hypothetical protein
MDRAVFLIALRVMTRANYGMRIASRDATILRNNALPTEADLAIGDLACEIIGRYLPGPQKTGVG